MPHVAKADELTSSYGTPNCRQFRQHVFSDLSPIAVDLALRYARVADSYSYDQANQKLLEIHDRLRINDLNLCASTDDLKDTAARCAEKCRNLRQKSKTVQKAYQSCLKIIDHYGMTPPIQKGDDLLPAINRMCDANWWFRKIKVLRLRSIESVARNIELVSRCRSTYASDYTVKLKNKQKENNRLYLSSTFISNEIGERFSLQDLADRSVSNPAIRRAELMVRIKGFEMVAGLLNHGGEFYTLTTPSRMHACLHNGKTNPRFDGTTAQQAHEYLTHLWALIRSELFRQGIKPYGFRVVEPHHDGTPHWHLLLFMPNEHREIVRNVMQSYALLDSGNEPGALKHRFKAVTIDPAKGTAAGYIAKYIAKNIDGHELEKDLYGNDSIQAAERITAWASIWGIRQFQQIGGPSVTVWRQLRRLEKVDDVQLETLRQAATASDWAAFMLAMGGPETERNGHAVKPFYAQSRRLNPETGEIIFAENDRYGGQAKPGVVGVLFQGKNYDTRKHYWMHLTGDSEAERDGFAATAASRTVPPQLSALSWQADMSANECFYASEGGFTLDLYQ